MNQVIKKAKNLLSKICIQYKYNDKDIMQGVKGEKLHALDVLKWVEKINPKASDSLKLAALFHDIDRIVTSKMGGGFKGNRDSKDYEKHKKMHAKRSADFIIPLLREIIKDKRIINKTNFLIINHDNTGLEIEKINDVELNHLAAADSFAFFTSIAPKLYKAEGEERIRGKIKFMVDKLSDSARIMLWEQKLENEVFNKLKNDIIKEYYIINNPKEKEYIFCPTCKFKLKRKIVENRNLLSCSKCGFIFWNNPKLVVSVIIEKNGKILLIKRKLKPLKDYWCLPGGYVNYEEKPEDAVIRETREETNLNIKVVKLLGAYQIDNDSRGINIDVIYKGLLKSGKLKLGSESSKYEFFFSEKLPSLIAYKHREAIMDYKKI